MIKAPPREEVEIPHEELGRKNLPREEEEIPHEELGHNNKRGLIPSEEELSRRDTTKRVPKGALVLSRNVPIEEYEGHCEFIRRAFLGHFEDGSLPVHIPEASYNDDVNIPH